MCLICDALTATIAELSYRGLPCNISFSFIDRRIDTSYFGSFHGVNSDI